MSVIALENHEIDFARFNDSTSLNNFFVNGAPVEGYNVDLSDGVFTMDMFLNMSEHSVLSKSSDLRKAVLYALNSEDIMYAQGNDENTSFALTTRGTPAMAGAQPQWENEDYYDYDPEKAAEYLKAAGYAPGEITLTFMSGTTLNNDSVRAVVVNNLEEAGFKVELLTVDGALFNLPERPHPVGYGNSVQERGHRPYHRLLGYLLQPQQLYRRHLRLLQPG